MDKLGFTFYPQDWWSSDSFFEFDPFERYIYLECLFLMYRNNGYMKTQKTQFENRVRVNVTDEIWEKVTSKFIKDNDLFTSLTVNKRLKKATISRENGKLGGRPKTQKTQPDNLKRKRIETERESELDEIITDIGQKNGKFILINPPYAGHKKYRLHGVDGIQRFMEMNGSKLTRPEFAEKFLREKDGHPFNDFGHVLSSYNLFIEKLHK
jgi:hypothetical protein